jgi:membrane associated rhomboid family serine protease
MKEKILINRNDSLTMMIVKILTYSYILSILLILPFNESWYDTFCLFGFDSSKFQVHQIFTHLLIHSPIPTHLLYNLAFFIVFSSKLENIIDRKSYLIMSILSLVISIVLLNVFFKLGGDNQIAGSSGFVYSITTVFLLLSENNKYRFLALVFVLDSILSLFMLGGSDFTTIGHFCGVCGGFSFYLIYILFIKNKKSVN